MPNLFARLVGAIFDETPEDTKVSPDQPPKDDAIIDRTSTFHGRKLTLNRLFADAIIEVGGDAIEISAHGKTSRLDGLKITAAGGQVKIVGPKPESNSVTIETKGGSFWNAGKSILTALNVNTLTEADRIDLQIRVPEGTEIAVDGLSGDATIGDTHGDLTLNIGYNRTATVGQVANAVVETGSHATVNAAMVAGSLRVDAGYDSTIRIKVAKVTGLNLKSGSNADIGIGGSVNYVVVDAGFNSKLRMGTVGGTVDITTGSSAEVTIAAGTADSLRLNAGFDAKLKLTCGAAKATIKSGSSAVVSIGPVSDRFTLNAGFDSETNIAAGSPAIAAVDISTGSSAVVKIYSFLNAGRIDAGFDSDVRANGYGPNVNIRKGSNAKVKTF